MFESCLFNCLFKNCLNNRIDMIFYRFLVPMGADVVVVCFHPLLLLQNLERRVLRAILVPGPRVHPRHATIPAQPILRYTYFYTLSIAAN